MTVVITGVNDSPITEDEGLQSVVVGSEEEHMDDVLSNVKDMEEDELTVTSVNGESGNVGEEITLPSGASITLQEDGSYTYDPAGDFESLPHGESASDTFEYTVSDGNGGTLMSTLTLVVHGENNGPRAADDSESTTEDAAVSSNVLPNDSDPEDDTLTVKTVEGQEDKVGTAVTLPSGATVTLTSDGAYTFDPSGQYESLGNGDEATESFAYTISDGHGGTDEATVTVAITGVNDSPITEDEGLQSVVVGSEEEHMDDVLSNVKDMEEDELTVTSVNGESGNVLGRDHPTLRCQYYAPGGWLLHVRSGGRL